MLVAIRSFVDPTDGGEIIAGRTEVAPSADVARMFPDAFKPAGKIWPGTITRLHTGTTVSLAGAGTPAKVKRPALRREPEQQTGPVPWLDTEKDPTFTVQLSRQALRAINQELDRDNFRSMLGSMETGGNLVGRSKRDRLEVLDATGPYSEPGGDREVRRMEDAVKVSLRSGYGLAEELARTYNDSLITFGGGWHSHPLVRTEPSTTDRASALSSLEHIREKLGWRAPDRWVDLILTPDEREGWSNPRAHGWVTRFLPWDGGDAVTERCNVVDA